MKSKIAKKETTLLLNFAWWVRMKLWAQAIIAAHSNIKLEWKNWSKEKKSYECHLETGEVFIP